METVDVTATPDRTAAPNRTPRPLWNASEHLQPNADERENGTAATWRPAVLIVFESEAERDDWRRNAYVPIVKVGA